MNGLITISDGQGTTISDGTIDTDNLTVDNFTVINMLVNYMSILRDSNPVVNAALGSTVDIGLLVQNSIFDDINRLYQIWDDTATYKIFEVDVLNKTITFNNSTVSFPNSTVTVTGALTTNRFLLNIDSISSSTVNWAFGDKQNIFLTNSLGVTFNLPLVTSSAQYGTVITIVTQLAIGVTFNAPSPYQFIDEDNNNVTTKTYTNAVRIFSFMAITTTGTMWRMMYAQVQNLLVTNNTWTGTNAFNTSLPTSTVTPSADNQLITRIYADSRYAELATANAFTSTNSFSNTTTFTGNIVANSLTITPVELGYIDGVTSSIQTQLNGKATLSTANAFTSTNSFSSTTTFTGNIVANALTITPTELGYIDGVTSAIQTQLNGKATLSGSNTFTNTNSFTGGSCLVTTQPENTNNTTAVSTAYFYRMIRGDSTLRNISIGQNANPANVSANNFALGFGALQNAGATSSDCVALGINSLNALTTGYYCFGMGGGAMQFATTSTRCVALGYATFPNGNPTNSVCIGANSGSASSGSENYIFGVFTANSLSSGSYNFICGSSAALVLTTGNENIICGYASGGGIITGSRNTLLGTNTSASGDFSNGSAIGYNAVINANNEIALGTSANTVKVYGDLITNGTTTAVNINATDLTLTGSIISATDLTLTGAILLNTADIFYSGSSGNLIFGEGITLNTPAGNNLLFGRNGATIASANCYNNVCLSSAGCNMTGTCDDNVIIGSQNVDSTSTINRNILIGTQIHYLTATTSTDNVFIGYRASTANKNQTYSTAIGSTATVNNSLTYATAIGAGSVCTTSNTIQLGRTGDTTKCDILQSNKSSSTTFQYLTQNTLITAATTLTNPLFSYYPFTMKTAAAYTVTLPEITASTVGTQLVFKRVGGSLQSLLIAMSVNQPAFLLGTAIGTLSSFTLCSTAQSCGTMVAIESQNAGAGTFTNAAASTTITIVTQSSGTLSIGGIINCNGNVRYITAYGSTGTPGLGGTGTYIVNTAITLANTAQAYTSSVTYGWAITSIQ
jgi:hypothetical protein